LPKTVQIIEMAKQTALAMGTEAYLVLDAYFAVTGRFNLGHFGRVQNRSVNFPFSYVVLS
jgi:hypothetical protein